MKKQGILILLIVGCIFSSGLLGFFIGRNTNSAVVEVSNYKDTNLQSTVSQTENTILTSIPETIIPETTVAPATESESTVPETTVPETIPMQTTTPSPVESTSSPTESELVVSVKININTATLEELDTLPGIGPVLAQRIMDYREQNGPFTTVSELTMISGIGLNKLEKLLDYVTVGGEE